MAGPAYSVLPANTKARSVPKHARPVRRANMETVTANGIAPTVRAVLPDHRSLLAVIPSMIVYATADPSAPMADPVRFALLVHTRSLPALHPAPFASVAHIPLPRAPQRQARA